MLQNVPSSFAPSTTRALRGSFWSSDSSSRFRLMIWSMGGRVVDRDGDSGVVCKRNRGLMGKSGGQLSFNAQFLGLMFDVRDLDFDFWVILKTLQKLQNIIQQT